LLLRSAEIKLLLSDLFVLSTHTFLILAVAGIFEVFIQLYFRVKLLELLRL